MDKIEQARFDRIMKNCHLPTRLDMSNLIKQIEKRNNILEAKRVYWEEKFKKENRETQRLKLAVKIEKQWSKDLISNILHKIEDLNLKYNSNDLRRYQIKLWKEIQKLQKI